MREREKRLLRNKKRRDYTHTHKQKKATYESIKKARRMRRKKERKRKREHRILTKGKDANKEEKEQTHTHIHIHNVDTMLTHPDQSSHCHRVLGRHPQPCRAALVRWPAAPFPPPLAEVAVAGSSHCVRGTSACCHSAHRPVRVACSSLSDPPLRVWRGVTTHRGGQPRGPPSLRRPPQMPRCRAAEEVATVGLRRLVAHRGPQRSAVCCYGSRLPRFLAFRARRGGRDDWLRVQAQRSTSLALVWWQWSRTSASPRQVGVRLFH